MTLVIDPATDLRERPIPLSFSRPGEKGYREYPVDLTLPLSDEPLVNAEDYGLAAESYYARTDGMNAPYYQPLRGAAQGVWIRRTVAEKLVAANRSLEPYGVELFLLDGYRSIACQQAIYDWFHDMARRALPDPTDAACREYISPFISDPSIFVEADSRTWISHVTGGAIDLTLRRIGNGEWLAMGGVFDDPCEVSYTDHFERLDPPATQATAVEARRNRRLLFWTMVAQGFSSLFCEWWHYDFGDQLWSRNRVRVEPEARDLVAFYGPAKLPPGFR